MTNSALLRRIVQMLIILSTNVTCSEADKTFNRTNQLLVTWGKCEINEEPKVTFLSRNI